MSFLLLSLIVPYGFYRGYVMTYRINPEISTRGTLRDLRNDDPFLPTDLGFDFALGFSNND